MDQVPPSTLWFVRAHPVLLPRLRAAKAMNRSQARTSLLQLHTWLDSALGSMPAAPPTVPSPSQVAPRDLMPLRMMIAQRVWQLGTTVLSTPAAVDMICSGKLLRAQVVRDAAHPREEMVHASSATPLGRCCLLVELLHIGTLIHDDVMDRSALRRNRPTVNALYGDSLAAHAGLWAISEAVGELEHLPAWAEEPTCRALLSLCEGQLAETMRLFDPGRTADDYLAAVRSKTGALFGLAATLGSQIAGRAPEVTHSLAVAAENIGVAYQIIDDVLDFDDSQAATRGKTAGSDVREGVFTLPIILAVERDPDLSSLLVRCEGDASAYSRILLRVKETGGLRDAATYATQVVHDSLSMTSAAARPLLEAFADRVLAQLQNSRRPPCG